MAKRSRRVAMQNRGGRGAPTRGLPAYSEVATDRRKLAFRRSLRTHHSRNQEMRGTISPRASPRLSPPRVSSRLLPLRASPCLSSLRRYSQNTSSLIVVSYHFVCLCQLI